MNSFELNTAADKESRYQSLLPQIESLCLNEKNVIANLSNIAAALKQTFNWWWVGFYLVHQNELIVGPFQGPVACTRIALGKGVCGNSWLQKQTIVVANVHEFEGHIACSSESQSEIVVPIIYNNKVLAVLDADSQFLNHFDDIDTHYLEKLTSYIAKFMVKEQSN